MQAKEKIKIIVNDVYEPIIDDKKRYIHLYGGSGSGKSHFVAQNEILKSLLTKRRERILVVRKVANTLKDSVFAELQDVVDRNNLESHFKFNKSDFSIKNISTKAQFILTGLDDPKKKKSIQGITRVWVEEATDLTKDDFLQLTLRLRGAKDLQFTFSYNPIDRDHWIKAMFHDKIRDDTTLLHTTFEDNVFIDEEYKKILLNLKDEDENYYTIYTKGEWGGLVKGLIYKNWSVADKTPAPDEVIYGLDFGFNVPSALIHVGIKEKDLYVKELIYEKGLTNSDLIERIRGLKLSNSRNMYADSAEPQRIEEIHRQGYNIYPAHKSVTDQIDFLKRFVIHIVDSPNLISELRTYKYKEDKNGKVLEDPVKFKDHAINAIQYAVYTHLFKTKGKSWVDFLEN